MILVCVDRCILTGLLFFLINDEHRLLSQTDSLYLTGFYYPISSVREKHIGS